jgi:hypothetical protein
MVPRQTIGNESGGVCERKSKKTIRKTKLHAVQLRLSAVTKVMHAIVWFPGFAWELVAFAGSACGEAEPRPACIPRQSLGTRAIGPMN